jgi:hypothetical protein
MEVILIHKAQGVAPPEMMAPSLEMGKKMTFSPEEMVPGGKSIFSYAARAKSMIVCLWEVPSVDVLMPALEQMNMIGWETDIIPVEKMEVALPKFEQALKAMMAK